MRGTARSRTVAPLSRAASRATLPHPEPGLTGSGTGVRNSGRPGFRGGSAQS